MEYYNNECLIHYGVKGMKWGIRRYQNEDGSLTTAGQKRLTAYKNKELERNEKKWDNKSEMKRYNKTDAKLQKAKESGNEKRVAKLSAKREDIDMTMKFNNAMKAVEHSKINKMSYSQMREEQQQVKVKSGKAAVESVLVSALGTAVLLPTTGRIYIHATVADPNAIKTNMRVSNDEVEEIYNKTHR